MNYLKKWPVQSCSSFILLMFLSVSIYAETWIFRTFPYQTSAEEIKINHDARKLSSKFYRIDIYFQNFFSKFSQQKPHPDVVLVKLGYGLFSQYNTVPLPRTVYANIVDELAKFSPKTVLMDVIFEVPQTPWVKTEISKIHDIPEEARRRLIVELDHDLKLKRSLANLKNYITIYAPVVEADNLRSDQEKKAMQYLSRQVHQAQFKVTGTGELKLFPLLRLQGIKPTLLTLSIRAKGQGFVWLSPNRHGTLGVQPLFHRVQTTSTPIKSYYLPSAVSEAARIYLNQKSYHLKLNNGKVDHLKIGNHKIKTNKWGEININFYNYRNKNTHIPSLNAIDLIYPKPGNKDTLKSLLKNKIILFGINLRSQNDFFDTSKGKIWGTEIMAYALSNILQNDMLYRPNWATGFHSLQLIILFLLLAFATLRLKPLSCLLFIISLISIVILICGFSYLKWNILLSAVLPTSFILIIYIQSYTMMYIIDEKQKRFYKDTLGLYLSPQLTDLVSENPELLSLHGEEKELTVLFSDIRGFTSISEALAPKELISLLHEYFSPMTNIVFANDGTLDKYIGDAIMAFWGAPLPQENHATLACKTALDMLDKLEELQKIWNSQGKPDIKIGIGLNTGVMRVGNMGSDKRLSYTVMGDQVNLGARLEGLTKNYGVQLIVAESTWRQVKDSFYGRLLDKVVVKGKKIPVPIYEIMGSGNAELELTEDLKIWEAGQSAYQARKWDIAEQSFKLWHEKYTDLTAKNLLLSIAEFKENPPDENWQAISVMTTK